MVQSIDPLREMQDRWERDDRRLDDEFLWKIQWQDMPVHRKEPLAELTKAMPAIAARGKLVLGWIIQANDTLWTPGANWAPGWAVFQRVGFAKSRPEVLAKAAEQLQEVANWTPTEPDHALLIRCLSDDMGRPGFTIINSRVLGIEGLVLTSFVVIRRHLPGAYLRQPWLPLIVAPDVCPYPAIVPGELWTPGLLRNWIAKV